MPLIKTLNQAIKMDRENLRFQICTTGNSYTKDLGGWNLPTWHEIF